VISGVSQTSLDRKQRNLKREIKLTLVVLTILAVLFGAIISFLYVNFTNIFKTELSLVIFVGIFIVPTFIMFAGNFQWLKKNLNK
jgi:nitrate/nitrite transporter NarK